MGDEARGVMRNAGLLVVGFSLLMMLASLGSMLWMDLPLLLVGLGLVGYALLDARKAARSLRRGASLSGSETA
jgi:hypothetical protein